MEYKLYKARYAITGVIQGLIFVALFFFKPSSLLMQALEYGLYFTSIFISLSLVLIFQTKPSTSQLKQIMITGLLLGGLSFWMFMQQTAEPDTPRYIGSLLFGWGMLAILLTYIVLPFIQSQSLFKWRSFNYHDLYQHSWDNFFVVALAGLFLLIYWLLLLLCTALFKMLGIGLVKDILFHSVFLLPTMSVMFAIGVGIGHEHEKIIATLRLIALTVCRYLLPLSALITVVFAITLLFTGLEPIWETGVSTHTLLWLIVVNLVFINGVFQDGVNPVKYSTILKVLINIAMITMTVFALIAVYSVYLRIAQYGLTPRRIYVMIISLLAVLYTGTYSRAAIKSFTTGFAGNWLEQIKLPNVYIAYGVAGLIIILHSPILDPLSMSARSQYNRALDLQTDLNKFDLGVLFYKFGNPGREYLQQLENKLSDLPAERHNQLKNQLTTLKESNSYYEWNRDFRARQDGKVVRKLVSIDPSTIIPPALLNADGLNHCRSQVCEVLFVDLTRDGKDEALILTKGRWGYARVYALQLTNKWKHTGNIKHNSYDLIKLIRAGKYHVIQPRFNSLAVDGVELQVEIKR